MKVKPFSDVRLTAVSAPFDLFMRFETFLGIFNYQNKSPKQKTCLQILSTLIVAATSTFILVQVNFNIFVDDGRPMLKKLFYISPVLLHLLHYFLYAARGNLFMGWDVKQFIDVVYKIDTLLQIPAYDRIYAKTRMKSIVMLIVCIFIQSTIWLPLHFMFTFKNAELCAWIYLYLPKELSNVVLYIHFDMLAERLGILSSRLELFMPIANKMIFYKYDQLQKKVNWKKAGNVKVNLRDVAAAYKCIAELNEKIIDVHSLEVFLKLILGAIYLYDGLWLTLARSKTLRQDVLYITFIWLWTVLMLYLIPAHCVALDRLLARRRRILIQLHDITADCNHGRTTQEDAKAMIELLEAYSLGFPVYHLVDLDVHFIFRVVSFFSTVIVVMLQIRDLY